MAIFQQKMFGQNVRSLLDVFVSAEPLDEISSIREHLIRLLNARRGSLVHMPEYGLPDIGEIYQGLPYSLAQLKRVMAQLIECYEPRLKNVQITYKPLSQQDDVVHLEIRAMLVSRQTIVWDTYFLSGGKVMINY